MFNDLTAFLVATVLAVFVLFITMVVEDPPRPFRIFMILVLGGYCILLGKFAVYGLTPTMVRHPLEQQITICGLLAFAAFGFVAYFLKEVTSSKKCAEAVKAE